MGGVTQSSCQSAFCTVEDGANLLLVVVRAVLWEAVCQFVPDQPTERRSTQSLSALE